MRSLCYHLVYTNLYGRNLGATGKRFKRGQCTCSTCGTSMEWILWTNSMVYIHHLYGPTNGCTRFFFTRWTPLLQICGFIHSDLSFRFLHKPLMHMAFQLQLVKDLVGRHASMATQPLTWTSLQHTVPKAWRRNGHFVGFVENIQTRHVHAAKFTYAKDFAIGITTIRGFIV